MNSVIVVTNNSDMSATNDLPQANETKVTSIDLDFSSAVSGENKMMSQLDSAQPNLVGDFPCNEVTSPSDGVPLETAQSKEDNSVEGERRTSVSFSTLEMREYDIIPGDNPSVLFGVPITIDWEPVSEVKCDIDSYESCRPEPRTMTQLRIPGKNREEILKRGGYTFRELTEYRRVVNIARNQRKRTMEMLHLARFEESCEKVFRAVMNATIRRRRKRKEREFLDDYIVCIKEAEQSCATTVEDNSLQGESVEMDRTYS